MSGAKRFHGTIDRAAGNARSATVRVIKALFANLRLICPALEGFVALWPNLVRLGETKDLFAVR
jgi:hypothetical protein